MDERKILAALLKSRSVWDQVKEEIELKDFSPEAEVIFSLIKEFYDTDTAAKGCDPEILLARSERQIASNKIADVISAAIRDLQHYDVSAVNVGKELVEVKLQALGNKIAARLINGKNLSDGKQLSGWLGEYERLLSLGTSVEAGGDNNDDEVLVDIRVADLVGRSFRRDGLLQLYPKALNDQIDGGVRGGHHILIFAPTEMGKSLFAINMCYGFLRQNKKVLYIGNEDPAPDMLMRMMTRLTGMTKYEILAEPDKADGILGKRNWGLFTLASLSPGTFPKISKLVDKYTPSVLVLDQLRNLNVDTENRTQALEKAATEARNLAKRYDIPVISITQAGDSASGKTVLDRGDVDGSNVGIPGQTDLMIGIGATKDMEERNIRMLSFPKNKLSGRHQPVQIQIDPFLSMVVE